MIDVISPNVFSENEAIQAFFTLKNSLFNSEEERYIKGLNLGFNTNEPPEIIKKNRAHLLDSFGIESEWTAFANQVHSNRVKVVTNGGTFADTDSLITQVPGLALAIQVADCAAVLIADLKSRTIAAVHAGWRGAAGDIIPRTLNKMADLGAEMKDCKAFVSPCISLKNFEVGKEVADQFPDKFVDYQDYSKPHINLKGFLADQLQSGGLKADSIEIHQGCTVEEERFYSYRREQDKSGRMMAIIKMNMR